MKNRWGVLSLSLILVILITGVLKAQDVQDVDSETIVISVAKVEVEWKGIMNIPIWASTDVFFIGTTPFVLPKNFKTFKLRINWEGKNNTRLDEEAQVMLNIEAEEPPYSGNWRTVIEKKYNIVCRKRSSLQKILLSPPIHQTKPEVRYKISVNSILPVGPRSGVKTTYLTVRLSSIVYYTYTTLPFIPLTILHDPNGDHSWSGIKAETCILHLLSLQLGNRPMSIHEQKDLLFHDPKGTLRVRPFYNKKSYLEISFFPSQDITSEQATEDPCLIGPGIGDVYVIAKNIPLKLLLVENFSYRKRVSSLYFSVVSPQEAGLGPDKKFEILFVPAASLRFYEEGYHIFGTWDKYGISDSFREQLIKINFGWDNIISPYEKSCLEYIGEIFLDPLNKTTDKKEELILTWKQQLLHPIILNLEIDILPSFVEKLQIPVTSGKISLNVMLNSKPYSKSITPADMVFVLDDNERGNKFPDFFSYEVYLDRFFGTPLFITKDDKTAPANIGALHVRSISSLPKEFWTGVYEAPIISGQITDINGNRIKGAKIYLKQEDKIVREGLSNSDGVYSITAPSDKEEYTLLVQAEGYEDAIIPFVNFHTTGKRTLIFNISMPPKPAKVISKLPELPAKEVVIPETIPPMILLNNSDFSDGLEGWRILQEGLGDMKITIVTDPEQKATQVISFHRQGSEQHVGHLGITQNIDKNVSVYDQITLSADIKIISSTFEEVKTDAYPLIIEVEYKDTSGKTHIWKRGFFCNPLVEETENNKRLHKNKWTSYVSPNLAELKPRPEIISKIKIYGHGWDFHSRITKLIFVAKELPASPVTVAKKKEIILEKITTDKEYKQQKKGKEIVIKRKTEQKITDITREPVSKQKGPIGIQKVDKLEEIKTSKVIKEKPVISAGGLIKNYDFSAGMKFWRMCKIGGGKVMKLSIVKDSEKYPHVLDFNRYGSGRRKGLLGAEQIIGIDVSDYNSIIIKAEIKVLYTSLNSDGRRGGAYPVTLEIEYKDKEGCINRWRHGFLPEDKRLNYPDIGEKVAPNKWILYTSPNLAEITPKPVIIDRIKVYGQGWGFHGRVANVALICEKKFKPEISEREKTSKISEEEMEKILDEIALPEHEISLSYPIKNNDFATGLKYWKTIQQGTGELKLRVIKEDTKGYQHVLDISRNNADRKRGKIGVYQDLNLPAKGKQSIVLSADIKVIYSSLKSDGTRGGAYPVTIEITYLDKNNKKHTWRRGFLYAQKINYPNIGRHIPKDKWVSYSSGNLLTQIRPKPYTITKLSVYGCGWDFHSRVANICMNINGTSTMSAKESIVVKEEEQTEILAKKLPEVIKRAPDEEKATDRKKPEISKKKEPEPEIKVKSQQIDKDKKKPVISTGGLIKNHDFSAGMKFWRMCKIGGGKVMKLSIVNDSEGYTHVLDFIRHGSGRKKGLLGAEQIIGIDVSDYNSIIIKAEIKVLYTSLNSDGRRGGAYPVTLEIEYKDKEGCINRWRHGFLPEDKRLNYPDIGEKVAPNKWILYTSPNLAEITPKPVIIDRIKVYGQGWGFHGRVANVALICEKKIEKKPEKKVILEKISDKKIKQKVPEQEVAKQLIPIPEKPKRIPQQKKMKKQVEIKQVATPVTQKKTALIEKPEKPEKKLKKKEQKKREEISIPVGDIPAKKKTTTLPENILKNGEFSDNLNQWKQIVEGSGNMELKVVNDSDDYPHVLEIRKQRDDNQIGTIGIEQEIDKDISGYTLLAVVMDIKLMSSSFDKDCIMWLEIVYEDTDGIFHTWTRGFHYIENLTYSGIKNKIPKDKWYIYLSGNLMKLTPKPKILKKIRIYGKGYDILARVGNIHLIVGEMNI